VFVDSSGRRRRRIRIVGAALAVPAVVYLVILVSSVLGGPAPDTQFIPLPGNDRAQSEQRPKVKPTPTESSTGPERPDESRTPDPSSTPTTTPTQDPSVTPTPTKTTGSPTRTTPTPTQGSPATPGHGKPTVAPGRTKSPSKP
jgi:hypothetical protein